ncbi:recombinase [Streptomyces anandii]|uniref:recombinase n=1 Tax=Streptomyces anandii TaxID=285454 RepID=UPI0036F57FC0
MLTLNPTMLPRLDELEEDLLARRERAMTEDWRGEIEGIDLTLSFLRSKRQQAQHFERRVPVSLGLPSVPSRRTDGKRHPR